MIDRIGSSGSLAKWWELHPVCSKDSCLTCIPRNTKLVGNLPAKARAWKFPASKSSNMQWYNAEVYKNYMPRVATGLGSRFILPWSLAHCVVLLVQTSLDGIRNLCKEADLAGLVFWVKDTGYLAVGRSLSEHLGGLSGRIWLSLKKLSKLQKFMLILLHWQCP